ncbi:MAG: nucleotidyltransferase domain-containing protein [Defluviitaleaceae bacterium]|nr:nucleotidyltransferase domain-containing protein [Defluviitaleaceae bacterium]MCL2238673.1 nucleotidyltransferase domain-containing protein [Defluviitaleaceae bacterium]
MLTIPEIKSAVEKIAPKYPVKQVQLFGSYADGFAHPGSDVDIIVEFSQWPVSLWTYCGFQQALSDLLNIKVDMIKYPLSKDASEEMTIQKVVHLYG